MSIRGSWWTKEKVPFPARQFPLSELRRHERFYLRKRVRLVEVKVLWGLGAQYMRHNEHEKWWFSSIGRCCRSLIERWKVCSSRYLFEMMSMRLRIVRVGKGGVLPSTRPGWLGGLVLVILHFVPTRYSGLGCPQCPEKFQIGTDLDVPASDCLKHRPDCSLQKSFSDPVCFASWLAPFSFLYLSFLSLFHFPQLQISDNCRLVRHLYTSNVNLSFTDLALRRV